VGNGLNPSGNHSSRGARASAGSDTTTPWALATLPIEHEEACGTVPGRALCRQPASAVGGTGGARSAHTGRDARLDVGRRRLGDSSGKRGSDPERRRHSGAGSLTPVALTAVTVPRYRQRGMTTRPIGATDGDLARAIGAGAGTADVAETELYRRFAPRVRLYGLRHLRNEEAARDLVQQVMLVVLQKLRGGLVRELDQVASFILGVSRTMAKDLKRREWRREKLRDSFLPSSLVEAPASDVTLDLDRLERCLARLADRERSVVLLTFYAEKSGSEVSQELRVTEGNVRVIRHRAIERLRTCMTSREEVP
jgi:RNA polymerase sigma-70 factor, ECF subfamily